jgi:hypothetical protein
MVATAPMSNAAMATSMTITTPAITRRGGSSFAS